MNRNFPFPFFVFGSQYHRAPVPPPDEWEKDFELMQELNFNTMKFWVIWRWVERRPGEYRWEDYDGLIDCAHRHGIKVVPNTVLEMAPKWLYETYPESVSIDEHDVPSQDLIGQAYQLGGFCPDWNCEEAHEAGLDFMRKAVARYASHPAVLTIDIWNEPTSNTPAFGAASQRAYRKWLNHRFGSIEAYNAQTGQAEADFEGIRIPTSPSLFPASLLYREFKLKRLCEWMKARTNVVHELCPETPACSHCSGPGSTLMFGGADDWLQAECCDFYGNSMHQTLNALDTEFAKKRWPEFPMALDGIRSASAYSWVSELRSGQQAIGWEGIFYQPEDLKFWLWTILGHGLRGVLFWQFKPERIGPEAPECGLVTLDSQLTSRCVVAHEFGAFCRKHEMFLREARPEKSGIGILCGAKQNIMSELLTAVSGSNNLYFDSLAGIYRSFWRKSIPVEFIHFDRALHQDLQRFPNVLFAPFLPYLDARQAELLKKFVAEGGILIAEAGLGSYDDRGWHTKTLPAFGLNEVFGLRERERMALRGKRTAFHWRGGTFFGRHYRRELVLEGATVLGCFDDGEPAITEHGYGDGKAYYIATHVGSDCIEEEKTQTLALPPALVAPWTKGPAVETEDEVTVRFLTRGDERMGFAFNRGLSEGTAVIELAAEKAEILCGGQTISRENGKLRLHIPPRGILIFKAEQSRNKSMKGGGEK